MTMEEAMDVIQTSNEHFGFYGTMRVWVDPNEVWPMAVRAILAATRGQVSETEVRDFLDSEAGALLAEEITGWLVKVADVAAPTPAGSEGIRAYGLHGKIIAVVDAMARKPDDHLVQRIRAESGRP